MTKEIFKKYSKSSMDIVREGRDIQAQELGLQKIVFDVTQKLASYPVRKKCLLCGADLLEAELFNHRGINFFCCDGCGHIQSYNQDDASYDKIANKALGYEGIYPKLDKEDYESRCARVYKPKADWLFEALAHMNVAPRELKWFEIGTGAGNFLKVLQNDGCKYIKGIEIDPHNANIASSVLGDGIVSTNYASVGDSIQNNDADIYVAFFVLEHVREMRSVINSLKQKPKGTLFAFSVPVFGFITLFESVVNKHYPRSLDAMMHTQIYTEESLAFFLDQSGYEIAAEWVFGQDMMDVQRFLSVNLSDRYPKNMYDRMVAKVSSVIDPMQSVLDRAHFSDARHVLAIKR